MYKTRLDIQESLILPTPKVKALLRTHIFSYFTQNPEVKSEPKQEPSESIEKDNQMEVDEVPILEENNVDEYIWVLRIQGKIMPVLEEQPGGFYRKFSYFFNKIEVDFDPSNSKKYDKVEWVKTASSDTDGFEIKRTAKTKDEIKLKISFYLNYYTPEYQVSNELAKLIGIKQDTRPKILNHIWQYIKLNSLQDNENPNMIINNRELQSIFRCERMDVTSLTARLVDHVKLPDPIVLFFTIKPVEDWTQNQKLYDFIVNIDDPHFLDISNFLSNSENESVLFPKSLFFYKNENQKNEKSQTETEKFYNKLQDYDRNINELMEKLKKHKYKFDFYDAFAKDPTRFINNFLIQQNSLLKIMKEESSIIDARWDYNSAQYYKDYEVKFIFLFLINYFFII
jgi:chromatin remodeling complex protein RSC6